MLIRKYLLVVLAALAFNSVNAQDQADTLLAKDNRMIPLPTVGINFGFNHLMSDVGLDGTGPSPFRQFGYQLTITQRAAKFLNVSLALYAGTVYGEETIDQTNLNFRTSLFSQHLNLEYNFYPLLKPDAKGRQLIRPYLGFGVGVLSFRSKGDLKAENGSAYQFWSNGLIYAEEEGSVDPSEATPLERDFDYETDLRDANLDGLRKYSQTSFSLPINAGIRFQISKNVGVNAGFSYFMNFTDMVDNVSESGTGARQGSSGYDNHLYGSIGLSVFLGNTKPSSKPVKAFEEILATDEPEKPAESEDPNNQADENKTDLASISERLIKASTSIEEITENSDNFLTGKSTELNQITNRDLQSNKDLRVAKKESIAILDSSIAALRTTEKGLTEATSDLNSAYADFTDKKVDTRPSTTNKVRNAVEAKIPAMESLKTQIEAAKTPAELKSVLNVTSKNLTHTNEIFKSESSKMDQAILISRKAVVEAQIQQFRSDGTDLALISNIGSTSIINAELDKLFEEGMLSEVEYNQFKSTTKQVEETALSSEVDNQPKTQEPTADDLASTTDLLKTASETITQKTESVEKLLATYNQLLSSIAEQNIDSKKGLENAKKQAIELLEASNATLNETNQSLNAVANNLNEVSLKLSGAENSFTPVASTNKMKSTIEGVLPQLDANTTEIRSAKTAEDLNRILKSAIQALTNTSEMLSAEKALISQSALIARKEVANARMERLSSAPTSTDSEEVRSVANEFALLQEAKVLSKNEIENLPTVLIDDDPKQAEITSTLTSDEPELADTQKPSGGDSSASDKVVSDIKEPSNTSPVVTEKLESKARTVEEIENAPPKVTGGYHWADVDGNGWISPNEVLHFIDLLFEGESERSVVDIQNLIDYYFDQE